VNWPFARKDMEIYGAKGYAITVGPDKLRLRLPHEGEEQAITASPLEARRITRSVISPRFSMESYNRRAT